MDGPSPLKRMPRFSMIGRAEKDNVLHALQKPLSGYLGGVHTGGYWVNKLSYEWSKTFGSLHSIPCNSATSGLLAACMAAEIRHGDIVWVSAYTMSATATCASVLGAKVIFKDIELVRFSMNMNNFVPGQKPKAIIVTNLFGHPAYLASLRSWCDVNNVIMIEDNAQSPFAMEGRRYAGTIGHMGVFSLNVHKHIQSGEGGVVVTDDGQMGDRLRGAINHGELGKTGAIGLNLRMTETTAAIACAQLVKAPRIIPGRIALAEELTDMVSDTPWIIPPKRDIDCTHSYYIWAARVTNGERRKFVYEMNVANFPIRAGYSKPLNRIFDQAQSCPVAEKMEDEELITFEICAYDPKRCHLQKMREIIKYVKSIGLCRDTRTTDRDDAATAHDCRPQ